jgi:hypothetical protein
MVEGFAAEKISSVHFFSFEVGEVVGMRFLNFCLGGKYETIYCAMYSRRQAIYLRTGFDGLERGMMRSSKGLENG